LSLLWQDGLPYWGGLTPADQAAIATLTAKVADLLVRQQTRLKWLPYHNQSEGLYPLIYPEQSTSLENLTETEVARSNPGAGLELYPAYSLVAIPSRLKPRFPRYDHTHQAGDMADHPPVKVRWPVAGRVGLRDFMIEAIQAEGVAAWPWPNTSLYLRGDAPDTMAYYIGAIAIATAPWFTSDYKHLATAIAKLDYYLFA